MDTGLPCCELEGEGQESSGHCQETSERKTAPNPNISSQRVFEARAELWDWLWDGFRRKSLLQVSQGTAK